MSRLFSPIGLQLLATLAFAAIVTGAFQAAPALDRQHCITVSLASSQEKSAMLTDFADAYNAAKRSVDGYCVRIDPYQMNSGDA